MSDNKKAINPDQANPEQRRISSLLPATYNTDAWKKVFGSSIDYLFQPNQSQKFNAFAGGIPPYYSTSDIYIREINSERQYYQLSPGGVSLNADLNIQYSIFYDDLINAIRFNGGLVNDHNRLFSTNSYSWAPPVDLDKLQNYKQYYWVQNGPSPKFSGYPVKEHVGTGSQTVFTFDKPYVDVSDIKVFVDGIEVINGVDFVVNNRSIQFVVAPVLGAKIRIVNFRIIGVVTEISNGQTVVVAPEITANADDIRVLLNGIIVTDYIVTNQNGKFEVVFPQPLITGTTIEIIAYRQLNIVTDILNKKTFLDVNDFQYSSGMKVMWAYDVAPSDFNQGEWIVEGVGRSIRLAFDGLEATSGWDTFIWDEAAWSPQTDLLLLIRQDVPDYITIERSAFNNNPWSRTNRWFHYDILTAEERASAIQAVRPIIEFDRDLELFNYGRNFRGFVDLVINDMANPLNSFVNALNPTKTVPYNVTNSTIASTGSGYTNGGGNGVFVLPVLGGTGTPAQLEITLTSGSVSNVRLATQGSYTQLPPQPVSVGGLVGGSGAAFNLEFTEQNTKFKIRSFSWNNTVNGVSEVFYNDVQIADGLRILVVSATNASQNNRVYVVDGITSHGLINLLLETDGVNVDGSPSDGEILFVNNGYLKNREVYFNGSAWVISQAKEKIPQAPLFQLYDANPLNNQGVPLQDAGRYPDSTFQGSKVFSYAEGNGRTDPVLLQKLSFDGNGEINFNWNLITDRYSSLNGTIDGCYFYKLQGRNAISDQYFNGWYLKSTQFTQRYVNEIVVTTIDQNIILPWIVPDRIEIKLNGRTLSATQYVIFKQTNSTIIAFQQGLVNVKDVVQIYSNYVAEAVGGNFELPLNLTANSNNSQPTVASNTQFAMHFNEIIQNNIVQVKTQPSGNFFSRNAYRDSPKDLSLGNEILQHDSPLLKTMLLFGRDQTNFFVANRFVQREYNKFKNRYIQRMNQFFNNGTLNPSDPPSVWFNKIMKSLNLSKTRDFAFWSSTAGGANQFIPPTGAYLGLNPNYEPELFLDTTLSIPVDYIRGHDGSLLPAFNDFRDQIVLELENRIYNSINSKFKGDYLPSVNWYDIVPGKWRQTDYTKAECDKLLQSSFELWSVQQSAVYRNNTTYVPENAWSWNYTGIESSLGDVLQGSWRSVYQFYFDTDSPNTTPWRMLGFANKPNWWEAEYGSAPYGSLNTKLWEDLRDGVIRQGPRAGVDHRFRRPELLSILPVDQAGQLLNPVEAGIVNQYINPEFLNSDWKFGDLGPVELAWRRSDQFGYALLTFYCLAKPAKFVELGWDTVNQNSVYNNYPQTTQFLNNLYGQRPPNSLLQVHSENDNNLIGVQTLISHYLQGLNTSVTDQFGNYVRGLTARLGYKLGAYVDGNTLTVDSENFGQVPLENQELLIYTSQSIKEASYSGLIIRYLGQNRYQIFGYDQINPRFFTIPSAIGGRKTTISVGTASLSIPNWTSNQPYSLGDLVVFQNQIYQATRAHISSTTFQSMFWREFDRPAPPPAISAFKYLDPLPNASVIEVPYGSVIVGYQAMVNFIFEYQRWLISEGWRFNQTKVHPITGEVIQQNWDLSVREFLEWTLNSPPSNSLLALSPFATQVNFETEFGQVQPIEQIVNGVYSILNREGFLINPAITNVSRFENQLTVTVAEPTVENAIFATRLYLKSLEHAVFFDDITQFNDVIYDQLYNQRQIRLRFAGSKAIGWNGRLDAPGYFITENKIVPNFEKTANDFRRYFDLNDQVETNSLSDFANHTIAYEKRSYLDKLVISDQSQVNFYQGMIREKGTSNSLTKLLRSNFIFNLSNFKFYEEWGFRIGSYGNLEKSQRLELDLPSRLKRADPQMIQFNLVPLEEWKTKVNAYSPVTDPSDYRDKLNALPLDSLNDDVINVFDFVANKYQVSYSTSSIPPVVPVILSAGSNFAPNQTFTVYLNVGTPDVTAKFVLQTNSAGQVNQISVADQGEYRAVPVLGIYQLTENELEGGNWPGTGSGLIIRISFENKPNSNYVAVNDDLWQVRPDAPYPFFLIDQLGGKSSRSNNKPSKFPNAGFVLVNETTYSNFKVEDILQPPNYAQPNLESLEVVESQDFNPGESLWIYDSPGANASFNNNYLGDWTTARVVNDGSTIRAILASDPNFVCPLIVNSLITGFASYIGDGSTTGFAIPFAFTSNIEVVVYVNGTLISNTQYTISASQVQFNTAPVSGSRIEISQANQWIYQKEGPFKGWSQILKSGKLYFTNFININNTLPLNPSPQDYVIVSTGIESFTMNNLGENYIPGDILTLDGGTVVTGGFPATFRVNDVSSSYVSAISLISGGSGYVDGSYTEIPITGGNGTPALVDVTVVGGSVVTVTLTSNQGSYNIDPPGNVVGLTLLPGAGAQFAVTMTPYTFAESITLASAGSGYQVDDVLEIIVSYTTLVEPLRLVVTEVDTVGAIVGFTVTATGQWIPGIPLPQPLISTVVFPGTSAGAGATFNVTFSNLAHIIKDIDIVFPGNYSSIPDNTSYNLLGGNGSGAQATTISQQTGFVSGFPDPVRPGDWITFTSRIWQRTVPGYEYFSAIAASNLETIFTDPTVLPDLKPIEVYTLRESKFTTYADMIANYYLPQAGDRAFVLDASAFFGVVDMKIWAVFEYTGTAWSLVRKQNPRINADDYDNGLIYDRERNIIVTYMQHIDPYNGKISQQALKDLTYVSNVDPANYNTASTLEEVDPNTKLNIWKTAQVGQTWWDLSTVRFLDYEQEDNNYRRSYWGKTAPGSSIDVYEWVRTNLSPTEYADAENFPEPKGRGTPLDVNKFNISQEYNNQLGRNEIYYYFWVKNKDIVPNVPFRNISVRSIANQISDPTGAGLVWYSPISENAAIFSGIYPFLNENTTVQINWNQKNITSNWHSQWALHRENDPNSLIEQSLWNKLRDSLVGFDQFGETRELFDSNQFVFLTIDSDNPGVGYTDGTYLCQPIGGNAQHPAMLEVTVVGGSVASVTILNPGIYLETPTLPFAVTGLIGGGGATFSATFGLSDNNENIWLPKPVPDPNLSEVEKYGNLTRPRQTWFRDKCKARKEFVEIANFLLNQILLDVDRPGWNINIDQSTPLPFTSLTALPNQRVATDVNDFYNQIINGSVVPGTQVLVLGNSETNGFWTLWLYESSGPRLLDYQRYNTSDFYVFVNWYASGIDPNNPPAVSYPTRQARDLDTLEFAPGRIVIVENDGNGKWEWTRLQQNESGNLFWNVVAKQNGTINLSNKFYENCGNLFGLMFDPQLGNSIYGTNWDLFDWDLIGWDQLPASAFGNLLQFGDAVKNRDGSLELFYLIKQLRERILNSLEDNQLFFGMVKYVHSEQSYVDWAFKTSFISFTGYSQPLTQSSLLTPDLTQSLLEYVDEIKPYHVKVRSFVRSLSAEETANFYVTDFDKPVYFDTQTGTYRVLSPTDPEDIAVFEAPNNPGSLFNVNFLDIFLNFPRQTKTFNASGGDTIFAMDELIVNMSLLEVRVNSVIQTFNVDYFVDGASVVFFMAPAAASFIEIIERQLPAIGQALVTSKNLWNDWFVNYQNNPDLIRRNKITMLLDRVSCVNPGDLANWDEFDWSTNNWDSQNNLTNLNAPVFLEIATIQNQLVYNLSNDVQSFPTLWNPINIMRVNYYNAQHYRDLNASEYEISYLEQNFFVGDGVTLSFTLSTQQTANVNTIQVKLNGVVQTLDVDYSLTNNTVIFNTAPGNLANIEISIQPKLILNFSPNDQGFVRIYRYLESLERIMRYYVPGPGQLAKSAIDLIPVCGFQGTIIEGGSFEKTLGWDYFLWDWPVSWDTTTVFSNFYNDTILQDGLSPDTYSFVGDSITSAYLLINPIAAPSTTNVIVYVDQTLLTPGLDYNIAGNTINFVAPPALDSDIKITVAPFAPSPANPWDVKVDGYTFMRPQYGPNQPEERVNLKPNAPVQFKVYTTWSSGVLPIQTLRSVGNGVATVFAFDDAPQSVESVMVFVDGLLQLPPVWSLNMTNKTIDFAAPPAPNASIEILIFGWGGTAPRIGTWAGNGPISSRSFESRKSTNSIESRVTDNGAIVANTTNVTTVLNNQTNWNVNLSAPGLGIVSIDCFDTAIGSVSDMRRDIFTASGGTETFALSQSLSSLIVDQTQLFVFRNGERLGGADVNYFVGNGIERVFNLTFDPLVNSNVIVYVNGILQTQGVDYTVGPNPPPPAPLENYIIEFFPASTPAANAEVLVVLQEDYWFRVSLPNQVVFDDPNNILNLGDEIVIYSISNAATSSIRTETFKGRSPGIYNLSQIPSTANHLIVSVDGKHQTQGADYLLTKAGFGWDLLNWDLDYLWDEEFENVLVFKTPHVNETLIIADGVQTQFITIGLTNIPITSLNDAVDVFLNGARLERGSDFDLIFTLGNFYIETAFVPNTGDEILIRSFAKVVATSWSELPAANPVAWFQYSSGLDNAPNWVYWRLTEDQKLSLRTSIFSNSLEIQANQNANLPVSWRDPNAVQEPKGINPLNNSDVYNPGKILISGELISYEELQFNPINRFYTFGNLVRSVDRSPFGTPYAKITALYNGNGSNVLFNVPSAVYNRVIVERINFVWNAEAMDYVFDGTTTLIEGMDYVLAGSTVILNRPPPASPTSNYPASLIVTAVQFDWEISNLTQLGGVDVWALPEKSKFPVEFTQNWMENEGVQYNKNNVSKFLKTGNISL